MRSAAGTASAGMLGADCGKLFISGAMKVRAVCAASRVRPYFAAIQRRSAGAACLTIPSNPLEWWIVCIMSLVAAGAKSSREHPCHKCCRQVSRSVVIVPSTLPSRDRRSCTCPSTRAPKRATKDDRRAHGHTNKTPPQTQNNPPNKTTSPETATSLVSQTPSTRRAPPIESSKQSINPALLPRPDLGNRFLNDHMGCGASTKQVSASKLASASDADLRSALDGVSEEDIKSAVAKMDATSRKRVEEAYRDMSSRVPVQVKGKNQGAKVTASAENTGGEQASCLFDGSEYTKWLSFACVIGHHTAHSKQHHLCHMDCNRRHLTLPLCVLWQ